MRQIDDRYDRRTLMSGVGVTLFGVGLAGCTGPGGGGEDNGESEDDEGSGSEDEGGGGGYSAERDGRPHQPDST